MNGPQGEESHPDKGHAYGRRWVDSSEGKPDGRLPCLRVAQWNVLADSLAAGSDETHVTYEAQGAGALPGQRWVGWGRAGPPADYQRPHIFRCPPRYLTWDYRGPRICEEIKRLNADVIALQEVDKWLYIQKELSEYDGVFAAKTGFDDGVALLWRKHLTPGAGEVLRFSRGVQVALLQRLLLPAEGGKVRAFVVVSMHLKAGFTDHYEATRQDQLSLATTAIKKFAKDDPIVILADLNAHPKDICGVEARALPTAFKQGYASAYSSDDYTVWSGWTDGEVRAAFDHIIFTATGFRSKRVLELPKVCEVGDEECRLPNRRWPSDHLPLASDLILRTSTRLPTLKGDGDGFDSHVLESSPVCRYFLQGSCHYAQNCIYPHSDGRRGERCYFFDSGHACRNGHGCHFLHSSSGSSQRPPKDSAPTEINQAFQDME